MQATAFTYDPQTRAGQVLLDDGTPLPFDAAAFDAGGLRLLRPGQRVRIEIEERVRDTENPEHPETAEHPGNAEGGTGETDSRRITLITLQTL